MEKSAATLMLLFSLVNIAASEIGGESVENSKEGKSLSGSRRPQAVDADDYLTAFGYLAPPLPGTQYDEASRIVAIKNFQKMAAIPQTGRIDRATRKMMMSPRCGVPDNIDSVTPDSGKNRLQSRSKRYTLKGRKWNKNHLTYRFLNFTDDLPEEEVRSAISRAFKLWSDVSPLTFAEIASGTPDIMIEFATGMHGDGKRSAFDGPGRILAHAFFPKNGDAHFDDDELFTVHKGKKGSRNLFAIAAHEFGHSLGLGHSRANGSLMYPLYQGHVPADYQLPQDDVLGIQAIYGKPKRHRTIENDKRKDRQGGKSRQSSRKANLNSLTVCTEPFDAVFSDNDENIFAVSGMNIWRMNSHGVIDGFPTRIKTTFKGLPGNVDAAVTSNKTKMTYFFKGERYWKYNGRKLQPSYPKKLRRAGLPKNLDAALEWGGDGKIYIFKGSKYYEWDENSEQVAEGFPKKIESFWKGVPSGLDAALSWKGGKTYFFRRNKYWRFDDSEVNVDEEYPKLKETSWMHCGGS